MNDDYKFDVDLAFGQKFEQKFEDLFTNPSTKFEIKTERQQSLFDDKKWMTTGNIVIEIDSWGNKSGLQTTQADWWVHILSYKDDIKGMMFFEVDHLRKRVNYIIKKLNLEPIYGGQDNASRFYLIPIKELFNYDKQVKTARKEISKKTKTHTQAI